MAAGPLLALFAVLLVGEAIAALHIHRLARSLSAIEGRKLKQEEEARRGAEATDDGSRAGGVPLRAYPGLVWEARGAEGSPLSFERSPASEALLRDVQSGHVDTLMMGGVVLPVTAAPGHRDTAGGGAVRLDLRSPPAGVKMPGSPSAALLPGAGPEGHWGFVGAGPRWRRPAIGLGFRWQRRGL